MTVDARTNNLNLQKNSPSNTLKDDMTRAIAAMEALDTSIFALQTSVAAKANLGHSHTIADITGLQSALDGKAGTGHTHALGNLSDVNTGGASQGMVLVRGASGWQASAISITNVGGLSDYGRAFVAQADAAAARSALGLGSAALLTSADVAEATATSDALSKRLRFDAAQPLNNTQLDQLFANIGAAAYARPQSLSNAQLDQVAANIGAPSYLRPQTLTTTQKTQALSNIGGATRRISSHPISIATTALNIDIPTTGIIYRLRGKWKSAVSSSLGVRVRLTGEASARSDAGYQNSQIGQGGGSSFVYTSGSDTSVLTGSIPGSLNWVNHYDLLITPGADAAEWPRITGDVDGWNSAGSFMNVRFTGECRPVAFASIKRIDQIQLIASVANGIGVGSLFYLEEVI